MLCCCSIIVPCRVNRPFLLVIQSKQYFEASNTFFMVLVVCNSLESSLPKSNSSRYFSIYSIVASVWYQYCTMCWSYTKFLMHNSVSVNRIICVTEQFERVTAESGTIMYPSTLISIPVHGVTRLYVLLHQAKPAYGGSITQRWLNLSILQCF